MDRVKRQRSRVLRIVKRRPAILQLLRNTFTKSDRAKLAQAVYPYLGTAGLSESEVEDFENNFFALFCSWCGQGKGVPGAIAEIIAARSEDVKERAKAKQRFIAGLGLHPSTPRTADALPRYDVSPLPTPYPPLGEFISETEAIHRKWSRFFRRAKQADGRLPRRPVHRLDPSQIQLTVPADKSCTIYDSSTGELIGVVIRNFCPDPDVVEWAEEILEQGVGWKKSVRARFWGFLFPSFC